MSGIQRVTRNPFLRQKWGRKITLLDAATLENAEEPIYIKEWGGERGKKCPFIFYEQDFEKKGGGLNVHYFDLPPPPPTTVCD